MNLLQTIIDNGLSIRQIPLRVAETRSFYSYGDTGLPENHEIVETPIDPKFFDYHKKKHSDSLDYRFDGEKVFRRFLRTHRIPKYAGHWMCKKVTDTNSSVRWNLKTDNLAPTLSESVEKFLAAKNS